MGRHCPSIRIAKLAISATLSLLAIYVFASALSLGIHAATERHARILGEERMSIAKVEAMSNSKLAALLDDDVALPIICAKKGRRLK